MSSLDVYCMSHFKDKKFYATMVEIGLTQDRKDFVPNGYHMDEKKYPKIAAKMVGRKDKALASSSQQETEVVEEEEEENVAKEENRINLSDDKIGAPGRSEPPLSGGHLTSLDADREVLHKRNVMTPRTLFSDDVVVERAQLLPPGPTFETWQVKRAKQSSLASGLEASSLLVAYDNVSTKLLALEERVQRMTKSNFTMQASLQQTWHTSLGRTTR